VDIGGTKIAASLTDRFPHIVAKEVIFTKSWRGTLDAVVRTSALSVPRAHSTEMSGIGMALPSLIDSTSGKCLPLEWNGFDIRKAFAIMEIDYDKYIHLQ
jgi:predicted NBD/HSP70 family sugar kinase